MSRSVRLTALAPTRRGVFRVFGGVGLVAVGLNTACTNTAGTAPTAAPAPSPKAWRATARCPADRPVNRLRATLNRRQGTLEAQGDGVDRGPRDQVCQCWKITGVAVSRSARR